MHHHHQQPPPAAGDSASAEEEAAREGCRRRLEELVAMLAVHGSSALTDVQPAAVLHAARAICDGTAADGSAVVEAVAATCASAAVSGVLHLSAAAADSDQQPQQEGLVAPALPAASAAQQQLSAGLAFTLPPGYPHDHQPLQCHVVSATLPRSAVDLLSTDLQQAAAAAAARGEECLHLLAEQLAEALQHLLQQQQQAAAQLRVQHTADDGGGSAQAQLRRVLLRLDHMRDRKGYTATIKQWAAELQLTGWLLFWQQALILILLEGSYASIAEYLRRARTVCVDVDAAGRKCRERMMTVLEDSAGSNDGAGQPAAAAWQSFAVVEASSLAEVARHLAATHPHWTAQQLL